MDRDCKAPTATFEVSDSLLGYHEGNVNHLNTSPTPRAACALLGHPAVAVGPEQVAVWGGFDWPHIPGADPSPPPPCPFPSVTIYTLKKWASMKYVLL
jgi:hypothetical protein